MQGNVKLSINLKPLKKLANKSPAAFEKAMAVGAVQLLTWMNTGAGGTNESRKPPIRFGVLRGSSSAFVGSKLVSTYNQPIRPGADEDVSPARSHAAPSTTITVVWNTDYAAKMHEYKGEGGPYTRRDGDAGGKWIERHISADRDLLMDVIGRRFKKELKL